MAEVLSAQQQGEVPVVHVVLFRDRITHEDHDKPGILNYLPETGIVSVFWHDRNWWFRADSPEIALRLWERDAGRY